MAGKYCSSKQLHRKIPPIAGTRSSSRLQKEVKHGNEDTVEAGRRRRIYLRAVAAVRPPLRGDPPGEEAADDDCDDSKSSSPPPPAPIPLRTTSLTPVLEAAAAAGGTAPELSDGGGASPDDRCREDEFRHGRLRRSKIASAPSYGDPPSLEPAVLIEDAQRPSGRGRGRGGGRLARRNLSEGDGLSSIERGRPRRVGAVAVAGVLPRRRRGKPLLRRQGRRL